MTDDTGRVFYLRTQPGGDRGNHTLLGRIGPGGDRGNHTPLGRIGMVNSFLSKKNSHAKIKI
jgi:hypothetical protein